MMCAGSSARILQQLASTNKCKRCVDSKNVTESGAGASLRHAVLEKLRRNKPSDIPNALRPNIGNCLDSSPRENICRCTNHCGYTHEKNQNKLTEISKIVKVCVYTKASRPYLVIYDSSAKFATPVMHQKLKRFRVTPTSTSDGSIEDEVDNKRFRIYPNMSDDVIIFQATSKSQRDEWVSFLARLTQKEISTAASPHKTNHHLMKSSLSTLEEAEEPVDELQRGPLKAPTRRQKSREGRKNSLTGIGVRLLRRPLARPLA